jgi:hypothetical protein
VLEVLPSVSWFLTRIKQRGRFDEGIKPNVLGSNLKDGNRESTLTRIPSIERTNNSLSPPFMVCTTTRSKGDFPESTTIDEKVQAFSLSARSRDSFKLLLELSTAPDYDIESVYDFNRWNQSHIVPEVSGAAKTTIVDLKNSHHYI